MTAFGEDNEIDSNDNQRMKCETIINMTREFIVSTKQYDDVEVDIEDIDKRPALEGLFRDIESGLVDTVVVYSLGVLSTSFKEIDKIMKMFKEHDVRIILARQGIDTATSDGRHFFLQIGDLTMLETFEEERKYFKKQDEEMR
jgi:DNA invertase Pin-like site-specific DNA recombinase